MAMKTKSLKYVLIHTNDFEVDCELIHEVLEEQGCSSLCYIITGTQKASIDRLFDEMNLNYKFISLRKLEKEQVLCICALNSMLKDEMAFELHDVYKNEIEKIDLMKFDNIFFGLFFEINNCFNSIASISNLNKIICLLNDMPISISSALRKHVLNLHELYGIMSKLKKSVNKISLENITGIDNLFEESVPKSIILDIVNLRSKVNSTGYLDNYLRSLLQALESFKTSCNMYGSSPINFLYFAQFFLYLAHYFSSKGESLYTCLYLVRSFECLSLSDLIDDNAVEFRGLKPHVNDKAIRGAGDFVDLCYLEADDKLKIRKLIKLRNISSIGHGFIMDLNDSFECVFQILDNWQSKCYEHNPNKIEIVAFKGAIQQIDFVAYKKYLIEEMLSSLN